MSYTTLVRDIAAHPSSWQEKSVSINSCGKALANARCLQVLSSVRGVPLVGSRAWLHQTDHGIVLFRLQRLQNVASNKLNAAGVQDAMCWSLDGKLNALPILWQELRSRGDITMKQLRIS